MVMPATPRFIYFDLGNVLLHFDHQIAWRQISELAGVPEPRVRELLESSGLQLEYERGTLSGEQFHLAFCEQTGSKPERAAFEFAVSHMFTLNASVLSLVTSLYCGGWPLGILSNTCEAHWQYARRRYLILERLFQRFALSYELQRLKPEAEIYPLAAELAGVAAEEIFFLDDRLDNVEAARAAGFDAVPFVSAQQIRQELWQRGIAV